MSELTRILLHLTDAEDDQHLPAVKGDDSSRSLRVSPWVYDESLEDYVPLTNTELFLGPLTELMEQMIVQMKITNTQANVIHRGRGIANFAFDIDFQGALVLGEDDCVGVDLVAEGGGASVTILGYYQSNALDY